METRRVRRHRRRHRPRGRARGRARHVGLSVTPVGEAAVVRVDGELDLASEGRLGDHLDAVCRENGNRLILDLRGLSFIDCGGVRALTRLHGEARGRGGYLALAAPRPMVARVLDLSGMRMCLPVYESVAAARRRAASPGR